MSEKNSLEKWTVAIGLALFIFWFRPFVAVALWHTHLVPMGAPSVEFWWMFWALFAFVIVHGTHTLDTDKGLSMGITMTAAHIVLLLIIWLTMT